jgi:serine/threonine-protein kinase RsbW
MQTVTFPGRFESLAKISEFVAESARKAGLDETAVYSVQLAVDEACSNIIEHAYGGEDLGEIQCTCEITDEGLRIILQDRGVSFNPKKVPKPDLKAPLEDVKSRGAGLFLIRKVMDQVNYEFSKEKGNKLVLVKLKGDPD